MKKLYDAEGLEIPQLKTSFYQDKHWIYEQVQGNTFAKYCYNSDSGAPTGSLSYCTTINTNEGQYTVNEGEEVEKAVVLLPIEAIEYGTDEQLAQDIREFIHEWLDVDPLYESLATYYIMISWLYDQLHTIPYLRVLGDTGIGKTRFLDTVGGLCYKATYINGAITPAPVFRLQEKWKGTLVMDEGDLKESDATNEIMKMLNCGFEKGKSVIRCDKDHPDQISTHEVYGPKVIGTRQTFNDKALEARCITEVMEETSRDNIPSTLTTEFFEKRQELRNKLLLFRFRNLFPLQERLKTKMPPTGLEKLAIEPRLKQVGTPFAIVFHDKPTILAEFFGWVKKNQLAIVEERAGSLEGEIIEIIHENEQNNIDPDYLFVTAKSITDKLNEGRTKPLNPGTIGRILKSLGFENKLGRDEDGKVSRKIKRNPTRLQKLYKRYIPNFVTDVTDVTDVTETCATNVCNNYIKKQSSEPVTTVTTVTTVTDRVEMEIEDLGNISDKPNTEIKKTLQSDKP